MEPVSMENNSLQSAIHGSDYTLGQRRRSSIKCPSVTFSSAQNIAATFIEAFHIRVKKQAHILIAVWGAEIVAPEELQGDVTFFWD